MCHIGITDSIYNKVTKLKRYPNAKNIALDYIME